MFNIGDIVEVVKNLGENYFNIFVGNKFKIASLTYDSMGKCYVYTLENVYCRGKGSLAAWEEEELKLVSREITIPAANTSLEQQLTNCHHYIETQAIKITKLEEELAKYNCQTTIHEFPNGDKIILEKA